VLGTSITGYKFGSGGAAVVFVGGTHGNEQSSVLTLVSFIDSLEANFDQIPEAKTIYVIPNVNPDGYAANRRTNQHDVDLNRNFPANNWKSKVSMPDGSVLEAGGGEEPLSEPESSALASFILSISPRLVLTHHATGSLAIANESGISGTMASLYANQTGYTFLLNSNLGGTFAYDTTGAFEDWLHDKHGIPAILIEHSSAYSNEFWHHRAALWLMVTDS
jgi:protein MpaA